MSDDTDLITSDVLKLRILRILKDQKPHTPSEIAIKLQTNGVTVLRNCKFLEIIGFISIDVIKTKRKMYVLKMERKLPFLKNVDENLLEK